MHALPSSFKDPSGFVFLHQGEVFRAINECYLSQYTRLMESGLYKELSAKNYLISHEEVANIPLTDTVVQVIRPTQIQVISYAHEWSFSMLKDAAICTLNNAQAAINYGMILKDANTFNIQFLHGKPLLIDTLSFENYKEEESWIAYRQFCESFLAPLVLMKYCNLSLNKLLIAYPNGIPLAVCKDMLPLSARFNLHVYLHIFLQSNKQNGEKKAPTKAQVFSKQKMLTLLNGLKSYIQSLEIEKDKTTWDNYYQETILSKEYLEEKKKCVSDCLKKIEFKTLLDLGANEGEFSLLFQNTQKLIVAVDEDRHCIERLYLRCKKESIRNVIPLILDLTAPSPAIGWNNAERETFFKRIKPDVCLALALIHHLVIAHNISMTQVMQLLYDTSPYVVIEFVDKTDPKVMHLLEHRVDIFDQYTLQNFRKIIFEKFEILEERTLSQKSRTLFLLKRKEA